MTIFTKNKGLKGGHRHQKAWKYDSVHKKWVSLRKVHPYNIYSGKVKFSGFGPSDGSLNQDGIADTHGKI